MGMIESRTFEVDDGVALLLPEALGIPSDFPVRLEWNGRTLTMRPTSDDDPEIKRTWLEVLERLNAIGAVDTIGERLPVDIPIRTGG